MTLSSKIAYNTAVQMIGKFVTAGATFLILVLISRFLGLEATGTYSTIFNFITIFYIVIDFGINAIAVRDLSADPSKSRHYFNNLLPLRLLVGLGLIIFTVALSLILPYPYSLRTIRLGIFLGSLTFLSQSVIGTANIVFQVNLRYDLSVLAVSLGSALNLALAFLFLKFGVLGMIWAWVCGSIVSLVAVILFVVRYIFQTSKKGNQQLALNRIKRSAISVRVNQYLFLPQLNISLPLWNHIIKASLPLGIAAILNLIFFKIDSFLISIIPMPAHLNISNLEAVAIYNTPYKILEFALVVPTFFMNAVYPILVKRFQKEKAKAKATMSRALNILLTMALPTGLVLFIFAPFLMSIFGEEFSASVPVLRILATSMIFFYCSSLFMWMMVIIGKEYLLARFYLVAAIFNISINLILIPRFGYIVAAVTTGLTELLVLIMTGWTVIRCLKYFPKIDLGWWRNYSLPTLKSLSKIRLTKSLDENG